MTTMQLQNGTYLPDVHGFELEYEPVEYVDDGLTTGDVITGKVDPGNDGDGAFDKELSFTHVSTSVPDACPASDVDALTLFIRAETAGQAALLALELGDGHDEQVALGFEGIAGVRSDEHGFSFACAWRRGSG